MKNSAFLKPLLFIIIIMFLKNTLYSQTMTSTNQVDSVFGNISPPNKYKNALTVQDEVSVDGDERLCQHNIGNYDLSGSYIGNWTLRNDQNAIVSTGSGPLLITLMWQAILN